MAKGDHERQLVDRVHEVDGVHPDHHQLGVADPHHVDHAEHEVESEREQREHPAEQQPVQHRLEKVDVERLASDPT